jgi:hypothetical protein
MSFISTFEELSKLYESVEPEVKEEVAEETAEEATGEEQQLKEAAEDEAFEVEEPVEADPAEEAEEAPEEEPEAEEVRQVVLECANCGGLTIKQESEAVIDEESDLANVDEACQYCEEAAGYKIIGMLTPYNTEDDVEEPAEEVVEDEVVEEGLLDVDVPVNVDIQANGNNVPFMNAGL